VIISILKIIFPGKEESASILLSDDLFSVRLRKSSPLNWKGGEMIGRGSGSKNSVRGILHLDLQKGGREDSWGKEKESPNGYCKKNCETKKKKRKEGGDLAKEGGELALCGVPERARSSGGRPA